MHFPTVLFLYKKCVTQKRTQIKLFKQVLCPLFYWFSFQYALINYPNVNQFLIESTQISGSQTTSCSKAISNWLQKVKETVIAHRIKILGITLASISGLIFTLNNCVIQVNNFQTVTFVQKIVFSKYSGLLRISELFCHVEIPVF